MNNMAILAEILKESKIQYEYICGYKFRPITHIKNDKILINNNIIVYSYDDTVNISYYHKFKNEDYKLHLSDPNVFKDLVELLTKLIKLTKPNN